MQRADGGLSSVACNVANGKKCLVKDKVGTPLHIHLLIVIIESKSLNKSEMV